MSHYFDESPDSPLKLYSFKETLRGRTFEFISASGVFSAKKVDFGTKLLADNMQIRSNDKVLDLGCGIGIIGIVASTITKNEVICTDINERACSIAEKNAEKINPEAYKSGRIKIKCGDMFSHLKGEKFDVILLNPPQTAGKKVCFEMIRQSKEHLNSNGSLQIVARHNKGGKTLSEKMLEVFGNMTIIAKKGGYRIYMSRNV